MYRIDCPDYSNAELLLSNAKGNGKITDFGWLLVTESGASSEMIVKINNKLTLSARLSNALMIPVSPEDIWEITYVASNAELWFVPNR